MTALHIGARAVATYNDGQDLAQHLSPRPYLHPVTTLEGTVLTEVEPEDHPHHHGVSNAVVEVNGHMFWGGGSYVHPTGYELLENHGRQVPRSIDTTDHRITQTLEWLGSDGEHVLTEDREVTADLLPEHPAWALRWHSTLHADAGDLELGSPATRGRTGAGYGGLFWRLSAASIATTATTADGDPALGSTSPWLLLTQARERGPVSLLLAQPSGQVLPWFVRTDGYVGAGPAIAWDAPRTIAAGTSLDLHLWALLVDGSLSPETAQAHCDRLERLP
ncbi:PmoA family protein [Occultella gossypii]|uniref:PmoA family protein n=1 Tax=Occultella gossypii TaxID=2800820 RepID=A0ABS7SDX6_9MICO|nr:PmoA family protein [Occultella gossypii]MBZ2198557.1 PmoA family protein [Occultella gossypii]